MGKRKLKIVFMAHDQPGYCAGPTINARRLLPEFQRRGHDVTAMLMYRRGQCPSAAYLREQGVECVTAPIRPSTGRTIRWILGQLQVIDPDVFVPNVSIAGSFAGRWAREAGIPTVTTHLSDDELNWGKAEQFACGDPKWAVSGLACVSEELTARTMTKNPKSQVATILHGSPTPPGVADQSLPLRFVYAGRLEETQKRISEVFRAVCEALERHPEATAKFIGSGSQLRKLQATTRDRNLSSRVFFTGPVDQDKVLDEMVDCNVLVLLSDYEGLPGAVVDAMSCGLVPVCLQCPGGLDGLVIHDETGLIVKDRDRDFQSTVDRLSNDEKLRNRIAQNARDYAIKHLSVSRSADLWECFFEELIAEAGPRKRITVPQQIMLPPIHPKLAREDIRGQFSYARLAGLGRAAKSYVAELFSKVTA